MRGGKRRQDVARVVTDRGKAETLRTYFFEMTLQLHELRAAVRSPVSRPEEHQHSALRTGHRGKRLGTSVLILERERRSRRTDGGPEASDVCLRR